MRSLSGFAKFLTSSYLESPSVKLPFLLIFLFGSSVAFFLGLLFFCCSFSSLLMSFSSSYSTSMSNCTVLSSGSVAVAKPLEDDVLFLSSFNFFLFSFGMYSSEVWTLFFRALL